MIDIKWLAENSDDAKRKLKDRIDDDSCDIDKVVALYEQFKKAKAKFDDLRAEQNKRSEAVSKLKKGSKEFGDAVGKLKELAEDVKKYEREMREKECAYMDLLVRVPNIPDDDVPQGGKESNEMAREGGVEPAFPFNPKDHIEIGNTLGILDFERAAKISGAHMPMFVGDGAMLEWALVFHFMKSHASDGYTCVIPPHLLNEKAGLACGQLPKFREDLYWTQEKTFLLPTAESALVSMHMDEILPESELPKKYFAYTPCYRLEAGSYRATDRGLKRVHQFNKVEMFQYTVPEKSEDALEELLSKAEMLVKELGLRYRIMKLAAGDIGFAMAKTYDVEVWHPYDKAWTEVTSVSNGRDFQARRGNIRYRTENGDIRHVHLLNASGLATPRLLVAILETYQQEDGSVVIPNILQEYVGKKTIEVRRRETS